MFLFKIAFRNVLRQRRRSLLTALTVVVGFWLLSISIGLAEGSYTLIIDLFTGDHTGHIQVHHGDYRDRPSLYKTLSPFDEKEFAGFKFIEGWTPRVYAAALAFHENRTVGVQVMGFDPVREPQTTRFKEKIKQGGITADGAIITYSLAQVLHLDVGDALVLISQAADGSIANDVFPVSGIIGSGDANDVMMMCYLSLPKAQEFLGLGDRIHEVAIMTDSHARAPQYAKVIRHRLSDSLLDVQPWQVVESYFYDAMRADIKGMWISIVIIMIMVALGVLNTVLMSLLERTYEFGIIKALGTRPWTLFRLIIVETLLLASFSIIVGSAISGVTHWWFTAYGIDLPQPIEYGGIHFTSYRSVIAWSTYWIPSVLTIATTLVVTICPAFSAMRKPPADALREY